MIKNSPISCQILTLTIINNYDILYTDHLPIYIILYHFIINSYILETVEYIGTTTVFSATYLMIII